MENFFIGLAWVVVLGGGAWAGAKAAFFTTLFFKVLFGKASEPTPQPQPQPQQQIVFVPMWGGAAGNAKDMHMADWDEDEWEWDEDDIIDVTPRQVSSRRTDWVE